MLKAGCSQYLRRTRYLFTCLSSASEPVSYRFPQSISILVISLPLSISLRHSLQQGRANRYINTNPFGDLFIQSPLLPHVLLLVNYSRSEISQPFPTFPSSVILPTSRNGWTQLWCSWGNLQDCPLAASNQSPRLHWHGCEFHLGNGLAGQLSFRGTRRHP